MVIESMERTDATTTARPDWVEVARMVADEIRPRAPEHDRTGAFVTDAFDRVRSAGLLRAPVPEELGGGGASHAEACEVLRVLGRADGSTAVTLSMHYHLTCTQVWRHLHGQPAEGVLRRIAENDLMLVSTGASDWLESSGSATRVDGGYKVNGRKTPSSGAPYGNLLVTSIRWDDAPDGPQVLHCAVPFDAPGVRVEPTWDSLGLRATGSDTVVLDDVFVPDQAVSLVRPAGQWHPVWNAVVGTALPLIMAAYLGIADAAVEVALDVARGKASAPHVPPLVGELRNHHAMAEDAIDAMIRRADGLRFAPTDDVAMFGLTRKTLAVEGVQATVRTAMEIAGGASYDASHPLARLHRDSLGASHHPLPRAKQVQFTGRMALGLALPTV
jgi:acyl-CoA dehydrogenase